MLVHTPNGNIPIVARYLQQSGLLLDHPSAVWDPARLALFLYLNPHNPPLGGHARNFGVTNRVGYPGPGGNKWSTPVIAGKSMEVQRSQVDEVFKSLKDGEELEETEPSRLSVIYVISPSLILIIYTSFEYCDETLSSPEESHHILT